eukprot:765767-Hanusia_phi.AAC.4
MGIFFAKTVAAPGEVAIGMFFAILGLTLFVDSLRVVVMPLSEQLGTELPKSLPLPAVLASTCFLGILVTYAEPAITSLRPLARLVDPEVAPYLYCALMEKQELLVFCIGLGVGLAAMLGTLRFVKGWSLKPMIAMLMGPTLMCAGYMWWGDKELRPLLGLAWDCGAVTTGPVTVPVLLALGIGVMKTQREKRRERESKMRGREMVANAAADALEGFGIVTLASLLPVLAVELLAIGLKMQYTHEDIINMRPPPIDASDPLEITPFREIYYAVRAILPLNVSLVLLVLVVLRKPLPEFTYYLPVEAINTTDGYDRRASSERRSTDQSYTRFSFDIRRSLDLRKSMDFIRSFTAFSSKFSSRGGLVNFGRAIDAFTAYTAATANGIPTSFRHASNFPFRKSMDRRSMDRRSKERADQNVHKDKEVEMAPRGNKPEVKVDENIKSELDLMNAAFTGELEHPIRDATRRSSWQEISVDNASSVTPEASGPEPAGGVGLAPMEVSVSVKEAEGSQSQEYARTSNETSHSREATKQPKTRMSREVKFNSTVDAVHHGGERMSMELLPSRKSADGRGSVSLDQNREESLQHLPIVLEPEPAPHKKYVVLLCGVLQAQVGMAMFNLGLNFGFTSIGDQVGTLLPAAFIYTQQEPDSPYYPFGAGVTIALGTMFMLGVAATRAEPALNVVGATVEKMTKGAFTKKMLIYSVCFGVGTGMAVGATKILFGAGLIWFILLKYAVALFLTSFTHEDFINIAWDSAGVTTGPVTVPFVLSTGIGCSKAVQASEGFGILACASVWPIITVRDAPALSGRAIV